jgi:hypothetical protein
LKVVDKFYPNFKLQKFIIDEGREKIIRKIKENLEKNKINFDSNIFNVMIAQGYIFIKFR